MARLQQVEDNVRTVRLGMLRFRGASFENVRALSYLDRDPDDLELSCYAGGILGADMVRGCCLVLDYALKRMSVAQAK